MRGDISAATACMASSVSAALRSPNTVHARDSTLPELSKARITLSKVGASDDETMASICSSCSDMPRSKAGAKCSVAMSSKGGTPKGVSQVSASSGFSASAAGRWHPESVMVRIRDNDKPNIFLILQCNI